MTGPPLLPPSAGAVFCVHLRISWPHHSLRTRPQPHQASGLREKEQRFVHEHDAVGSPADFKQAQFVFLAHPLVNARLGGLQVVDAVINVCRRSTLKDSNGSNDLQPRGPLRKCIDESRALRKRVRRRLDVCAVEASQVDCLAG